MSVEIWPPIAPEQLRIAQETTQKRELDWLLAELRETLVNLKHGLEDCYALLAPIDPGSTLVLSTPRNEIVKGTITRVGTRIVKGTIHLRLRTLASQTLTLDPAHPIHLAPLTSLHTLLNHSLDLLSLTLTYCYPASNLPTGQTSSSSSSSSSPAFLSAQLRLLSQSLSESSSILKGPPLTTSDPSWTTRSVSPSHFHPPLPIHQHNGLPLLSFHLGVQDGSIVLWLRALEDASVPPTLGSKLALAIGTARRLEHDEADRVFGFCCGEDDGHHGGEDGHEHGSRPGTSSSSPAAVGGEHPGGTGGGTAGRREVDVYVREKVRVESADPSLLSLAAKLTALGHVLSVARRNLAAVMGEELED